MTATATAPRIKSLTIYPGYKPELPQYRQNPLSNGGRGLVIAFSKGPAVEVVCTPAGVEQRGATAEQYAQAQRLVDYYTPFLNGGNCPSAPAAVPTTHQLAMEHEGGGLDIVELEETTETGRVKALRDIVNQCSAKVVEGQLVDLYSAGTFLTIYDALKPALQANMLAFSLPVAIEKAYQIMARVQERRAAK